MHSKTPLSSLVTNSLPNHNMITRKRSKPNRAARKSIPTLNNNDPSKKGEQSCYKNEASSSNPPTKNVIPQQNQVNNGAIAIANRRPQRILSFNLNEPPPIIHVDDKDESNPESITKNDTNRINAEDVITIAEDVITISEDEITNAKKIREADSNEPRNQLTDEEIAQIIIDLKNTHEPPNVPIENLNKKNASTIRDSKGKGKEIVAPTSYDLFNKKNVSTIRDSKDKGKEIVAPTSYDLINKKNVSTTRDSKGKGKEIVAPTSYDLNKKNVSTIRDSKDKGKEIVPEAELPNEDKVLNITSERPKANQQIWFKLSPSEGGNGGTLPPLTSPHILTWDQEITIDKVKMFIATKLNLEKEEIEVMLRGWILMAPTMTLGALQKAWKNLKKSNAWKEGEPPKEESVLTFTYARV